MDANELGRLFQRFRERHDLAALACVFDACAERLLGVARHLARDEANAEDLVQATFLVAIEQAERFERGRDFEAWLVGILTNKARQMHARGARSLDPERLPPRSVVDPAQDAVLAEFVAELDRAFARVPETYRAVLREHLANGRSPEEIARRLDRAPGTVRVQLHRGLAHLRRLLPAGFALGVLATTAKARGISGVREVVLTTARNSAPAAASTGVLAGVSLMNKKLVALCVVVVVLVGAGLNRYAYDAVLPRGDHWVCRESFHRTVCRNVELAELGAKDKRARRRARRNAILCTLEEHGLVRRTRGGRPWSQPRSESQA